MYLGITVWCWQMGCGAHHLSSGGSSWVLLPLLTRILRSTSQRGGGSESEEGALAVLMRSEGALCWSIPKVGKESSLSAFHEGVLCLSAHLKTWMFSSKCNSSPQTLQQLIVLCFLSPPSLFFPSQANPRHDTSKESSYPGISDEETLFFLLKTFHEFSF